MGREREYTMRSSRLSMAGSGYAPSLSMVVPALNEELLLEEFLRKSVADLRRVADDFEILLVDDGSTDRTLAIAKELAREIPELRILSFGRNLGTGKNIVPAYQEATKEIVFNNTVDAFFDTGDLPHILPHLEHFDAVSGYRTDLKANNLYQKALTTGNRLLIRLLFGMPFRAFQTLQFHRRGFLQQIELEAASSFLSPELLYKAWRSGKTVKEIPVTFHPRTRGKAKGGKPIHVLRSLCDIFRFWFQWVVLRRGDASGEPRQNPR